MLESSGDQVSNQFCVIHRPDLILTIKEALKRARKASSDTCSRTRILSHRFQFNGSRGSAVG